MCFRRTYTDIPPEDPHVSIWARIVSIKTGLDDLSLFGKRLTVRQSSISGIENEGERDEMRSLTTATD
jgi:hypothetical protein